MLLLAVLAALSVPVLLIAWGVEWSEARIKARMSSRVCGCGDVTCRGREA